MARTLKSLEEDLNAAADEMSDVAEALGLRRDAPHRKILERCAELRAIEQQEYARKTKTTGGGK